MENGQLRKHLVITSQKPDDDKPHSLSDNLDSTPIQPARTQPNTQMSWAPVAKWAISAQNEWRRAYFAIKATQEDTDKDWKFVAMRAIKAQDEWRKEYTALKATGHIMEEPKLQTSIVRDIVASIRALAIPLSEKGCQTEEVGVATEAKLKAKDDVIAELRAHAAERLKEKNEIILEHNADIKRRTKLQDQLLNEFRAEAAERIKNKEEVIDELRANAARQVKERDEAIDELRAGAAEHGKEIDELRANATDRETTHDATVRRLEKKIRQMHREAQSHRSLVANMTNEILRRDKALARWLEESEDASDSD